MVLSAHLATLHQMPLNAHSVKLDTVGLLEKKGCSVGARNLAGVPLR